MNQDQNHSSQSQPFEGQPMQGHSAHQYYPPSQPQRSGRSWMIPIAISIGCLPWMLLFLIGLAALVGLALGGMEENGDHVALIHVSGTITAGSNSIFDGGIAGSETIIKQLERARKEEKAKAIVLRINSPGGSAAGSEEVYASIRKIVKEGKPVYVSMGDAAASGGYYIASAADRIYADANSLTGSIGVIIDVADLSGLYKKIGLTPQTITSGKFKDMGTSNRPMTTEERALLKTIVTDIYNNFLRAVARGRGMDEAEVRKIADGRVLTGSQALKAKLIDEIGGLQAAIEDAAKRGGIKGTPKVVDYSRGSFFENFFGSSDSKAFLEDRAIREMMRRIVERHGQTCEWRGL